MAIRDTKLTSPTRSELQSTWDQARERNPGDLHDNTRELPVTKLKERIQSSEFESELDTSLPYNVRAN